MNFLHIVKRLVVRERKDISFSKEIIGNIISNTFFPFLLELEIELKELDGLFLNKSVDLNLYKNESIVGNVKERSLGKLIENRVMYDILFSSAFPVSKIGIELTFQALEGIDENITVSLNELYIVFYEDAYEVKYGRNNSSIRKTYLNEVLTNDEVKTIIFSLKKDLFNTIKDIFLIVMNISKDKKEKQ